MNLDFLTVVPAAKVGDKDAQDRLMRAFYGWSVSKAMTAGLDMDDAATVALGFWEWLFAHGIASYDAKKGNFLSWMGLVITRRARDAAKKRKPSVVYRSTVDDPYDYSPSPGSGSVWLEAEQDLTAIRRKLGKRQKAVLQLILAGATVEEIANSQGVSKKSASNLRAQVRRVIRDVRGG